MNKDNFHYHLQNSHEHLHNLETLLLTKLDEISETLLFDAEKHVFNIFSENLHREIISKEIQLGIWGNFSKNSKIRSIEFEQLNVYINIPKHLLNFDFGMRILVLEYDYLSHNSVSFLSGDRNKQVIFT